MNTPLQIALAQLDPTNKDHWTGNGQPRIDVLQEATGDKTITRQGIIDAAPTLTIETADAYSKEVNAAVAANAPRETKPEQENAPAETVKLAETATEDSIVIDAPAPTDRELAGLEGDERASDRDNAEVMGSPALLRCAIAEIEEETLILHKLKNDAIERMAGLSRQSELAQRQLARLEPKSNGQGADVKAYLEQSRKTREERAARAKAFANAGTSEADVRKALQTRSPLDTALAARGKSGARPAPRIPASAS